MAEAYDKGKYNAILIEHKNNTYSTNSWASDDLHIYSHAQHIIKHAKNNDKYALEHLYMLIAFASETRSPSSPGSGSTTTATHVRSTKP